LQNGDGIGICSFHQNGWPMPSNWMSHCCLARALAEPIPPLGSVFALRSCGHRVERNVIGIR
jgi:hypothetical protein